MIRSLAVALITTIVLACASSGAKPAARTPCQLPASDSIFFRAGPVYPACDVQTQARRIEGNVRPDLPSTGGSRSGCYSVDIEVVVDTLGHPETQTARMVKTTDDAYGQSVLALVPLWKFTPAMRDNRPVRQVFTTHESMMFTTMRVPV